MERQRRIRLHHGDTVQKDAIRDGDAVGGVDSMKRQNDRGVSGHINGAEFLIRQGAGGMGKKRRQRHIRRIEPKRSANLYPDPRAIGERAVGAKIIADVIHAADFQVNARAQAILRIVRGMPAEIGEVIALLGHLVAPPVASAPRQSRAVIVRSRNPAPVGKYLLPAGPASKLQLATKFVCACADPARPAANRAAAKITVYIFMGKFFLRFIAA